MKKWISILLAALLALTLFAGCAQPATDAPTETEPTTEPTEPSNDSDDLETAIQSVAVYLDTSVARDDPRMDALVAEAGDYTMDNRLLQYFFQMEYLNFMSTYGSYAAYFGLDTSLPLNEQDSMMEGMTWEQFFLYSAMNTFHQTAAAATEAKAAGFSIPQDAEEYISSLPESMASQAETYGYESVDAYVQDTFGPASSVDGYLEYLRLYYLAGYYDNSLYEQVDLSDVYDANEDSLIEAGIFKDDSITTKNVRHVLIGFEDADEDGETSDEEKAAALVKAQALLDAYLEDPSEDNFAAMANENSTDPGSNTNGGLYENIYSGQMVQPFNDWCFDESREYGDTGIVETTYGYHIMFYVGGTDIPNWQEYLKQNNYLDSMMDDMIKEMSGRHPMQTYMTNAVLVVLPVE